MQAVVALHPVPLMPIFTLVILPWVTPPPKLVPSMGQGLLADAGAVTVKVCPAAAQWLKVTDVSLPRGLAWPLPDLKLPPRCDAPT